MAIAGLHRIMLASATTRACRSPDELLGEIARRRRALGRALHHRERQDSRWRDVQSYGVWKPQIDPGGAWRATLMAIVSLGSIRPGRYAELIGHRHGITLDALPMALVATDVVEPMAKAFAGTGGLATADDTALAAWYGALDGVGGHQGLIARRGMAG
ncbi:hypothetical protein FV218_06590 [Methylobacterium sp. WL69]|uniref:hypothetical protein n=1 Tax=Methylobacterium sp. WL69 TaxID=2603893 RepID=UPI0011C976BC|nr:hypothetical protein [Methylobacterium sp. WL69]TXM76606.1 hypothetical protein FV218_06590 [Methylobacterium sp. WL69]